MTGTTMNVSLPRSLKRFVQERAKNAQFSNPSDYVRSLIREDQQRLEAEKLLQSLTESYFKSKRKRSPDELENLRQEFWRRWSALRQEIAQAAASVEEGKAVEATDNLFADVKKRGRARLAARRTSG